MAPKILNKTELLFWDHAIPRMTEDKNIQIFIRRLSNTRIPDNSKIVRVLFSLIVICGLVFGIFAYHLTHPT
jgi:hypothetical protein